MAEAVGDLAVDRAGTQRPLRPVVCRLQISVLDENEELRPDFEDYASELDPGRVDGIGRYETVEATPQVGLVGFQSGVLEVGPSSSDAQARSSRCFRPGPSTVSPTSMAYWTSRIRCAKQT